jgi:hypothetical protein
VLRVHPTGLSEFELIKALEAHGEPGFEAGCLRDNLSLFQTHFLLFNALYRLNDALWAKGEARLEINALRIQLIPLREGDDSQLAEHDPLRDYYLDLDNLKKADAQSVDELLHGFWERFVSNDDRREALDTLELQDPVDWDTIKAQHRRLVMQHHPDRGGDDERLQQINAAMEILARNHRSKNRGNSD